MGFFDFTPFIMTSGVIIVDPNKELINNAIQWADLKYSEECKNSEKAIARIKLSGNMLIRELLILQEEKARCYEDIISEDFSQMDGEFLPTEQMNELKRNRYLIIKRY